MDFFGYKGGLYQPRLVFVVLCALLGLCLTFHFKKTRGLGFYTCFDFQLDCKLLQLVVKKGSFPCSNNICVEVFWDKLLKEANVRLAYLVEKV